MAREYGGMVVWWYGGMLYVIRVVDATVTRVVNVYVAVVVPAAVNPVVG